MTTRSTTARRAAMGAAVALAAMLAPPAMAVTTLTGPSGFTWDIDDQGTGTAPSDCGSGNIGNGSIDAYDNFPFICITTDGTASGTECTSAEMYCGVVAPVLEMGGRQLVLGEATYSGLVVQRKVYVPDDTATHPADADQFVRYLDTFTNPGSTDITVQIRMGTVITGSHNNDLGSDSSTTCEGSSDGDSLMEVTDSWIATDDTVGSSDPSLGFVMQGDSPPEQIDFVGLSPYLAASDNSDLTWYFDSVTVAAGDTIAFLTFMIQGDDQTEVQAEATYLASAAPEALEGLTGPELGAIVNFGLTSDADGDGYRIIDGDCNDMNEFVHPGVTSDPCDDEDNDCDPATPNGSSEAWYGTPCDGDDPDLCEDGQLVCIAAAQGCNDGPEESLDVCDGFDNDCDPTSIDGSEDPLVDVPCDGPDLDLCEEGMGTCVAGAFVCTDDTDDLPDLCDGTDDDCDPSTPDGSSETWLGDPCDGDDPDLCEDGVRACIEGAPGCDDPDDLAADICDGIDNDCNPGTPDGSGDERVGAACDGEDADECAEGIGSCEDGVFVCSDTMEDTPELCDGIDNDCNPSTVDGVQEDWYLAPCDGADADLCEEGQLDCISGIQVCTDNSGEIREVCNGVDDDCDPETADGADETWLGDPCDGADTDLCAEGHLACVDGSEYCDDLSADNFERCNGVDDDCNPATSETADNDGDGYSACDGDCNDGDSSIYPGAEEICDGIDQDCDPMTDTDGDGDGYRDCEGDCADMNPAINPGADVDCDNGLDNDCNGIIDSEEPICTSTFDESSGCGCSIPTRTSSSAPTAAILLATLALGLALLRRRR